MIRTALFIAAALTAFAVAPALAQSPYYAASPSGEIKKASIITRNTLWKCSEGTCTAAKSNDRPSVMCELVVQRVGALQSFSAGGTAFDAEALARCNARAR